MQRLPPPGGMNISRALEHLLQQFHEAPCGARKAVHS